MSDPYKAVALTQAVDYAKAHADMNVSMIVTAADKFYAFLTGAVPATEATTKIEAEKPTKTTTKAKSTKPTVTEEELVEESISKAHKEAAEQDAAEEKGATKEGVGQLIASLLAANLRKETVALLKKYNATNASTLGKDDYETFVEEGRELLMAA